MFNDKDIIDNAKEVIQEEVEGLLLLQNSLDDNFIKIIKYLHECEGRIIITGMGKPGHIYKKVAATMASLGLKSYFLHPAEGLHGDLGLINSDDVVLAVSRSGESEEIIRLIPSIKKIGAKLLAITERSDGSLAKFADTVYIIPKTKEVFLNDLVPTTSTTVSLVLGDAIAVILAKMNGFQAQDFAVYHPNGLLGKKLTLQVKDIMHKDNDISFVKIGTSVRDSILQMCEKPLGCVCVVDDDNELKGIFTDGDLKRAIKKVGDMCLDEKIEDIMINDPVTENEDVLVVDALEKMQIKEGKFLSVLPVVIEKKLVGVLSLSDIAKAGLLK